MPIRPGQRLVSFVVRKRVKMELEARGIVGRQASALVQEVTDEMIEDAASEVGAEVPRVGGKFLDWLSAHGPQILKIVEIIVTLLMMFADAPKTGSQQEVKTMPLKSVLTKLEDAWEFISENSPDGIRAAAEMMHKTDVALFKAADFIDNLSPNPVTTEDVKVAFGVSQEKMAEICADLNHLKEEIAAKAEEQQGGEVKVGAMNPALVALLSQLLNVAIEELLKRLR
jgi:hypothetical protein